MWKIMMDLKRKIDYLYNNHRGAIIWTLLGLHTLAIAIATYQ
jgi:hypothetical protein